MKTVMLDGAACARRETAMPALEAALGLPDWWGRNLDALCDCLWEAGEVTLFVKNRRAMTATPFGRALWRALAETAGENPRLRVGAARRLRPAGRGEGRFVLRAGELPEKGKTPVFREQFLNKSPDIL